MDILRVGAWAKLSQTLAAGPRRLQDAVDKALLQEAHFFRTKIVEGIREQAPGGQAFAPLSPATLAVRRFRGFKGTKALLVQGDLRNSITVVKEGDRVFVGVLRTARGRAGQPLVDVAAVHEHGSRPIVMKLTPKARAFLHMAFRKAGLDPKHGGGASHGIAVVRVPARPFLGPVFDRFGGSEEASGRFAERVRKILASGGR